MSRDMKIEKNDKPNILCIENFFCINTESVNVCLMIGFVLLTQYIIKQFVGEAEFHSSSCMQYFIIENKAAFLHIS